MMNNRLILNKFAERDISISYAFYENKRNGLGQEFLKELKILLQRIESTPYHFPTIQAEVRKANMNRFPFTVFFLIKDDIINVFSVFHYSRSSNVWKDRIDR